MSWAYSEEVLAGVLGKVSVECRRQWELAFCYSTTKTREILRIEIHDIVILCNRVNNNHTKVFSRLNNMRVILEWQCEICKDIQLSDSIRTHHMDYCKCGESAVDLEKGYQRDMGKVKELKRTITEDEKDRTTTD